MRKFFLFFAALTIAVAANAFSLQMQNGKDLVSVTADNNDVFDDGGSVAVRFNSEKGVIDVELNNAELYSKDNSAPAFGFHADAPYYEAVLHIKGDCKIHASAKKNALSMYIDNGNLAIASDDPNASLDVYGYSNLVALSGDASMVVGNMSGDPFQISFRSKNESNAPLFCGYGSGGHEISFLFANVDIRTEDENPITQDITSITVISEMSNNVTVWGGNTFWRDGSACKESFFLTSPYPIMIGGNFLFADDANDFKPSALTKGKISFNHDTKTLTLDKADLKDYIWIGYDNASIYLKGDNYVRNTASTTDYRIRFDGKNAKIQGDADAWLTVHCNSSSNGIYAKEGLEIGDFNNLYIYGANNGLVGSGETNEANILKITTTPMDIYSSGAAIKDFETLTIEAADLQLPSDKEYTGQVLMNKEDASVAGNLSLYYKEYFSFYAVSVTARNAADIKVPGCEGKASYNQATATLTLDNFNDNSYSASNGIYTSNDLIVKLTGENVLSGSAAAIEGMSANLTIEGPGSIKLTSEYAEGIRISSGYLLTLCKGAVIEVSVSTSDGISSDATLSCTGGGWDPELGEMPAEVTGDAASLKIDNASVKVTTDASYAAIKGFKEMPLKDAVITAPAGAQFEYGCAGGSSDVMSGVMLDGNYVSELTITKTGSTDVKTVNTPAADVQKTLINGQLFIRNNGRLYTITGAEVK